MSTPHDFVVEGAPVETGDRNHGYLPFNISWYRKSFTIDASPLSAAILKAALPQTSLIFASTLYTLQSSVYISHYSSLPWPLGPFPVPKRLSTEMRPKKASTVQQA